MMILEDIEIEKGKDEEKISEKNLSLVQKLQQGNKSYLSDKAELDYVPVRGTWHMQNPTEDFDLDEHVDKFLQGEEKILLILGDSGAGKSVYCQQLIQRLQKDYSATEGKPISLFISLPSLKDPVHHAIEEALQSYGLKAEEITALKQNQKFIFILDAYDEIRQDKNLYVTNKLKDWNAKIIITCRSQYLYTMDHYVKYFMPYQGEQRQGWLFSEVVIKPFNQEQVDQYLQQYVKHHKAEWSDWQEYKKYIDEIPGLRKLIETPFLLKLVVEALPNVAALYQPTSSVMPARTPASRAQGSETSKQEKTSTSLSTGSLLPSRDDKNTLTRAKLYDMFVEHWFERQEKKLKDHQQIQSEENIQPKFWAYAKALAKEMQQQKVSQVFYETESDLFRESKTENPWKKFFDDQDPQISLLRDCCLLQQISKNHYAFFHASLIDYFVTREVYEEINSSLFHQEETEEIKESKQEENSPVVPTKASTVNPLTSQQGYFNQRLFTQEPQTLQFLADRIQEDEIFKQQLFNLIEASKHSEPVKIAAANAITILNWARVSFSGIDFSHINVSGADLSYGIFDHTNFSYADLSGVDFTQAWLREANLSQSQMQGVQFGEKPYLKHDSEVRTIAYSRDGNYLAAASDKNVDLWDWRTGKKLRSLSGHKGPVGSVSFSPDGETLASRSVVLDDSVRLWDLKSGQSRTLSGHTDIVNSVSFTPDGKTLASGSKDKTVRLWDLKSGQSHTLSGHKSDVTSVTFSSDGKMLASGSHDNTARLWDLKSSQSQVLSGHTGSVHSVAFSPDGKMLASGSWDHTVRLWDLKSSQSRTLSGHTGPVQIVSFSPDGGTLASGSYDSTVRLWEVKSGQSRILNGHTNEVESVSFSPNGETLASGSNHDKTVRLWEVKSGQSCILNGHTNGVESVSFSPDGETLAVRDGQTVRLWDLKSGQSHTLSGHMNDVWSMSFSPDGKTLASGSYDKTVRLWDLKSRRSRILSGHTGPVRSMSFSPDGETLASGSDDKTVRLWDLKSGQSRILSGHLVLSVSFSPDGQYLAGSMNGDTVGVWDVKSGQSRIFSGHEGYISSVTWSPDSKSLAFGAEPLYVGQKYYNTIWLWEVESGQSRIFFGHMGKVRSINFSAGGQYLASGNEDQTVRVWEVKSGTCTAVLQGYLGRVNSVCFRSADCLATGSYDGAVKLWQRVPYGQDKIWQLQWNSHASLYCEDTLIEGMQGLTSEQQILLQQRGAKGQPLLESSSLLSSEPLSSVKKSTDQFSSPQSKFSKSSSLASSSQSFIAQFGHQTSPYASSSPATSLLDRFEHIQTYVIQGLKKEKWILLDPDTEVPTDPTIQAVIHLKREIKDIRQKIETSDITNMKVIKERLSARLSEIIKLSQEKHSHTFLGKHHISNSKVVKELEEVLKKLAQESEKIEEEISSASPTSQKGNAP